MNRQLTQFSVMAVVGALAVVALFAVAFFAANGAQAENVTTNSMSYESGNGDGDPAKPQIRRTRPAKDATPTPTPVPLSRVREACSIPPAHAITGGAHALFEVYWDTDDQNLVNNPCPPKVGHIIETVEGPDGTPVPRVVGTSRADSDVNIGSTVIHMPDGLRLRVVEQAEGQPGGENRGAGTYAVPKNSRLFQAYDDDDTDKFVWLLPEWEPETPEDEANEEDELIHIGFSAALLRPADWDGEIKWNYETLREPEVAPGDRGVVLVTADPTFRVNDWDSGNPDVRLVSATPGEYEHRSWAFTKPGTYVLRVHARGTPRVGNSLGIENESVTSDISHYTFHAGSLADLNVAVSADNAAPQAGGVVTYTVNAGNAGPDTAPHGEVTVSLPEGLTYNPADTVVNGVSPNDDPVSLSDDGRTLTWQVGEMAEGYSATLSFKADVGGDTEGQSLEVTANIVAREEIGSSTVLQLDPRDGDNTSTVTIVITIPVNRPPSLIPQWSVEENATAGTVVARFKAVDPDGNKLFYDLSGEGASDFSVAIVGGGAQITVPTDDSIDYETMASYNLLLTVKDKKDASGNADDATDDTIGIMIEVTDVVDEASDLAFSVDPAEQAIGQKVKFTLDILAPLPEGASNVTVHINGPNEGESHTVPNPTFPVVWELTGSGDPGIRVYNASLSYTLDNDRVHVSAAAVQVTWTAATGN